jgi:hypothetical protein
MLRASMQTTMHVVHNLSYSRAFLMSHTITHNTFRMLLEFFQSIKVT